MDQTSRPGDHPESTARAILSRVLGIVAILLLYRVPDVVVFGVFAVSILVYFVPRPAGAKCEPPKWIKGLLGVSLVIILALMLWADNPPPAGSRVRPVFAYGLLIILLIQIVWDVVRHRMLKERSAQGAASSSD
jgi:hypothetical protein